MSMKMTSDSENEGGTGQISKEIAASLQGTANERHNAAGLGDDAVADAASPAGEAMAGIDRLSVRLGLVESAEQPASRRELAYLCRALGLRPGARVVDAPCGIGRHALGLARAGCAVTAIDADPEAIAEARRAACHPAIDYRIADLAGPSVLADGSQDAIASLYSCIGHGNRPERDQAILVNFGAALAPGALLVVGLANSDVALAGGDREAEFRHKSDTIRRRDRPDPDTGLLERDFAIVSADGGREELSETWRYYGYAEMTDMLARAGLALVACHGDFAARPGDPARDPHLLYLCRRSAA
jgi:SAM-dependent methyltransferase